MGDLKAHHMETDTTFIYGLKEIGDKPIRYIGKANDPKRRLRKHIQESKLKNTHKDCWIASCLKGGNNIEFIIIEEVSLNEWPEREKYWINYYSSSGIVNHAQGGKGGKPIKFKISYEEFKHWVNINLPNVKSSVQWEKYWKENDSVNGITKYPTDTYKYRGWKGWPELLSNENKYYNNLSYLSYEQAKKIIKKEFYMIKNKSDWYIYKPEIPITIPREPDKYYSRTGEWKCWKDFLNNKKMRRTQKHIQYLTYDDAKKMIKKLFKNNLSVNKWRSEEKIKNKIPLSIPLKPDRVYKKTGEWISWVDFFGN